MNRWVQEIEHLCADLGAWTHIEKDAVLIERENTILRLTSFQEHYLISIGVYNQFHQPKWVGFATIPRRELHLFLKDTL